MIPSTQPPQHGGTPTPDPWANYSWPAECPKTELEFRSYPQTSRDHFGYRMVKITFAWELECALTAALDEKREVEFQRDHLKSLVTDGDLNFANLAADNEALRTRLALAEGLVEALKPFANFACYTPHVGEPQCYNCIARDALRRWAEARTEGTTLGGDATMPDMGFRNGELTLPAIPSEPASRAVPITPVFYSNAEWPYPAVQLGSTANVSSDSHSTRASAQHICDRLMREGFGGEGKIFPVRTWVSASTDQPTPPTSRPTAREQQ